MRAKAEDPSGQSTAHMVKPLALAVASAAASPGRDLDPVFLPDWSYAIRQNVCLVYLFLQTLVSQVLLLVSGTAMSAMEPFGRANFDADRHGHGCAIGILDFSGCRCFPSGAGGV